MINIEQAIIYLEENRGLKLPHGIRPGAKPGGEDFNFDEERWNAFEWNPPGDFPELPADVNASPKPRWDQITGVYDQAEKLVFIAILEKAIDELYREKIIMAYGAISWEDEIQKRLRGATTSDQDVKRDELRAEAKAEKAKLATLTLDQLKNYGK